MNPGAEHIAGAFLVQAVLQADGNYIVQGELVGQLLEHVPRSSFRTLHTLVVRLGDGIAEEAHLAPQVVTFAPADELVYLSFPGRR